MLLKIAHHLCPLTLTLADFFIRESVLVCAEPRVRTELGKNAFRRAAPCGWNKLQKDLKLSEQNLREFKSSLKEIDR